MLQVEIILTLCKELDYPEDRIRFTAVAGQDFLCWNEVEDCVRRYPIQSISST